MKKFLEILFWVLTDALLIFGLAFFPSLFSVFCFITAILLAPIEEWQNLLKKFLKKSLKATIVAICIAFVIAKFPLTRVVNGVYDIINPPPVSSNFEVYYEDFATSSNTNTTTSSNTATSSNTTSSSKSSSKKPKTSKVSSKASKTQTNSSKKSTSSKESSKSSKTQINSSKKSTSSKEGSKSSKTQINSSKVKTSSTKTTESKTNESHEYYEESSKEALEISSNETDIISSESVVTDDSITNSEYVYRTPSGKRYHFSSTCGGKNSYEVSFDEAVDDGLTPCKKCVK